jgi:hypothetical protein
MPVQKNKAMKIIVGVLLIALCVTAMSCNVGKGCPSTGSNVGAEKIASGDPKAMKQLKKAGKFKS